MDGYQIGRDMAQLEQGLDEQDEVISALKSAGVVEQRVTPYNTYWVVPDAVREKLGLPKNED